MQCKTQGIESRYNLKQVDNKRDVIIGVIAAITILLLFNLNIWACALTSLIVLGVGVKAAGDLLSRKKSHATVLVIPVYHRR